VGQDGPDLEWFSSFLKRLWTDDALAISHTHLQDFVLSIIRFPPKPHGLRHQASAVRRHDTFDRLSSITQPTLVMTGDRDGLIDYENSFLLTRRLPNAELKIFPGLKHAFHLEAADEANDLIVDFIARVKGREGQDLRLVRSG
jgi:pimeloyl-ACP methyl ester carboxylesterase